MRFQEITCKVAQCFILILTALIMCGPLSMTSVCLAAGGKWTEKEKMPTARDSLSTGVANGKIYAIGGWPPDSGLSTAEEYDPEKDKWTRKADMPTARNGLGVSVVNGKIYAIGGWGPLGTLPTVEEYDPSTDTWAKKADMPTARAGLSISVVNEKLYAIGGALGANGPDSAIVEEYDPDTDTWTKKANMPTIRQALSASSVEGKVYAIGGITGPPINMTPFSSVEEYDPAADKWTKEANMPTARGGLSTCVLDGKIYAIGGAVAWELALSTVEIYDPVTDKWEAGPDMPTARRWLSASVVNGKIYVIGGSTASNIPLTTVEEYTPEEWAPEGRQYVSLQGKLATAWGEIKRSR